MVGLASCLIGPLMDWSFVGFVLGRICPWLDGSLVVLDWTLFRLVLAWVGPWLDQSFVGLVLVVTVLSWIGP